MSVAKRLLQLAAMLLVTACSSTGRPAAVLTVSVASEREFISLRAVRPAEWPNVAWVPVPATVSGRYFAYSMAEITDRPVVFIVQRRPHVPAFTISGFVVNTRPPAQPAGGARSEPGPYPSFCDQDSWIGAFFIEGAGPKPTGPVVLEYHTDTGVHPLLVDPRLHTIRARPALTFTESSLALTPSDEGVAVSMRVEVAGTIPALPLLVGWADPLPHVGGGGLGRAGTSFVRRSGHVESHWEVYFLAPIPQMIGLDFERNQDPCS